MEQTSKLGIPYIMPSQAQKHVTHNEGLKVIDALVQLCVPANGTQTPPGDAADGETFIVGAGATGEWSGRDGQIAAWQDGAWTFHQPFEGCVAWEAGRGELLVRRQEVWVAISDSFRRVGVAATPDDINRLAIKSEASLFDNAGADHRLKINKASTSDVSTLLFQTGYSGRAELGLSGDDDFRIKTSPDGAAWREVLIADAGGKVVLPADGEPTKAHIAGRTLVSGGGFDVGDGTPAGVVIGYDADADYGFIGALETGLSNKTLAIQPTGGPISFGAPTTTKVATASGHAGFAHASEDHDARLDMTAANGSRYAAIFVRNAALTAGQALSLNRYGGGVAIGKTSVTSGYDFDVEGDVRCNSLSQTSDAGRKTVLGPSLGLDFVKRLTPVTFRWKARPAVTVDVEADGEAEQITIPASEPTREHQGLVAQDVAAVAAEIGAEFGGYKDTTVREPERPREHLLDYSEFIAPLVSAVQELAHRISALESTASASSTA